MAACLGVPTTGLNADVKPGEEEETQYELTTNVLWWDKYCAQLRAELR